MEIHTMTQNKNNEEVKGKKNLRDVTTYAYTLVAEEGKDVVLDMIHIMRQSCVAVNAFFETAFKNFHDIYPDEDILTADAVWQATALEMANRVPAVTKGRNIFVSSSIAINTIKVRLGANIGFEVNLRYIVQEGQATITECTGLIHIYGKNVALMSSLEENGFTVQENRRFRKPVNK